MGAANSAIRPYPAGGRRTKAIRSLGLLQPFLHGRHLFVNAPTGAFSVIKPSVYGDSVTVFSEISKTLAQNAHDFVPFPLNAGPHGSEFVRQAAILDDIHGSGHIGAQTCSLVQRENGKVNQYAHKKTPFNGTPC